MLSLQDSPTVKSRSAVLSEWWAFLFTLHRTRGRRKPQELAHPAFKNGTQDGEAGVMSITAQPATYSGGVFELPAPDAPGACRERAWEGKDSTFVQFRAPPPESTLACKMCNDCDLQ